MKRILVMVAALGLAMPAWAVTDCEKLKGEIEAKIKAKGVDKFTLAIVGKDELKDAKDAKEVGTCEGGAKRILYKRG